MVKFINHSDKEVNKTLKIILALSFVVLFVFVPVLLAQETPHVTQPQGKAEDFPFKAGLLGVAAALAVGLSALGTAWAQSRIGAAAAGALAEKPELFVSMVVLEAIPETMIILGFVIAFLILGKIA